MWCEGYFLKISVGTRLIKIINSVRKGKVQLTIIFYLKQNEEVQHDLQRFEIFIFLSLLPKLSLEKWKEKS